MSETQIILRSATGDDEDFLWSMLMETLLAEEEEFTEEDLRKPDLARYVAEWGRNGDLGIIAEEGNNKIGAIWSRSVTEVPHGYGHFKNEYPEIAIAVTDQARGKGVGTLLLTKYLEEAREVFPGVSLSVVETNPAKKLYERVGFETVETVEGHTLMFLELD